MEKVVKNFTNISGSDDFTALALEVFRYQAVHVPVYKRYLELLRIVPEEVHDIDRIPFLPVSVFKTHEVIAEGLVPATVFRSSGTTGMVRSRHPVADTALYEKSFTEGFERFYGSVHDLTILALLPSYLEQGDSSLIYMMRHLIAQSGKAQSGFYLNNPSKLAETLETLNAAGERVLLFGVSYALLDLTEKHTFRLSNTTVMETGGMKGRRKEMVREELHELLKKGFGVQHIHSEYGMTELLSQAYSRGEGIFEPPPWMKVVIRDANDPFALLPPGQTGGINIIDLANVYSCSFIATQDLGKIHPDGTFEVLGRFDYSDLRGCNLLIA